MSKINSLKDWFRNWDKDRFMLFSDILVKVTMTYNFIDAIIKIIIAFTDSVFSSGSIISGVIYTITAVLINIIIDNIIYIWTFISTSCQIWNELLY